MLKKCLLAGMYLQLTAVAHAAANQAAPSTEHPKAATAAPVSEAERYARRCQGQVPQRTFKPQGTMLWGTKRSWDTEKVAAELSSVLVSVDLEPLKQAKEGVNGLRIEGGRLVALPASTEAGGGAAVSLVGTVLQGTASDGKPVEVAICGAEPSSEDPEMIWYLIEAWNAVDRAWENPCVTLNSVPAPRALAVRATWDATGAQKLAPGKFTFACENGAITKCITWGYKPWASHKGRLLADLHQACTRMARADYCGNGRSHTHQDTGIDMYDHLGLIGRTTEASTDWNPAKASFEAAWGPDGATCLSRTRDGRAMKTILEECPSRFKTGAALELGEGDRCTVQQVGGNSQAAWMLRNHSYGTQPRAVPPAVGKE